jgi:hypothetical protein
VAADDGYVGAQRREFVGGASPNPTAPAGDHDRSAGEEVFFEY